MQISFWEKETFFAHRDIIIVGAGFMGLWSAFELKKTNPNLNILIVEKGFIPAGASTRNAGFACFGSPTELLHDAEISGKNKMLQTVEMRYCGLQKIRSIFSDHVTGFEMNGGYECLKSSITDINEVTENLIWLNKELQPITKISSTFLRADEELTQLGLTGFDALIVNCLEGGLHSGKLLQALTAAVRSLGVEILFSTEVMNWEHSNNIVKLYTNQEATFTCDKVLFCTNAFTSTLINTIEVTPARGQVLITNEIPSLTLKGTFHFNEGYYYFRNINNRVLLGGARNSAFEAEQTSEMNISNKVQDTLEDFLRTHILAHSDYNIEQRWSGTMGFTNDKLPLLHRENEKVFAACACNGMGLALAPVIAEKVSLLLND